MFFRSISIAKAVRVIWIFAASILTAEGVGAPKPTRLHAFYWGQVQRAEKLTGPSKIYTVETHDLTNATRDESILQLSFLKHHLLPGDKLTFYDGNFTQVLREFNASTETPALSFFSSLPDAKVVFTANASDLTSFRSFIFLFRTVPKGTDQECNQIFYARRGNVDSSKHDRGSKSCRYTITLPAFVIDPISIIFENLTIPVGERLLMWKTSRFDLQAEGNPVKIFTHADNGRFHYISSESAVILEFNSTTQFKILFVEYKRAIDISGESGEITFPIGTYPKFLGLKYSITVPKGHVKLTFHDLYLPKNDATLNVHRYLGRKTKLVRSFDNSSTLETSTVVSNSNRLLVTYDSLTENTTARFRITYSTLKTAPKTCHSSSFPNVKQSKLLFSELYEGWEETYTCASGYGNDRRLNDVTVLCQSNSSWIYINDGECRKECPSIDGPDLLFALVFSLSFAFLFCVIVIGYCVLRYTSCVSVELRVKLFGPNVANSQHRSIELQQNSPLGKRTEDSSVVQS